MKMSGPIREETTTMRKSGALIWGILILLAAAGLLCYAFMPNLAVFTVPLWKWFAAAALIYWMVRLIFFSNKLSRRLSFVFPLALLFLVFECEIGTLAGRGPNFVNNWVIVLAAVEMTEASIVRARAAIRRAISTSAIDSPAVPFSFFERLDFSFFMRLPS